MERLYLSTAAREWHGEVLPTASHRQQTQHALWCARRTVDVDRARGFDVDLVDEELDELALWLAAPPIAILTDSLDTLHESLAVVDDALAALHESRDLAGRHRPRPWSHTVARWAIRHALQPGPGAGLAAYFASQARGPSERMHQAVHLAGVTGGGAS